MVGPTPILIGSQMLSGGGTEGQMVGLAKTLDPKRFEVHVICFRRDAVVADALIAKGVQVFELPVGSFVSLKNILHIWTLVQYLRKHQIRLFHAFDMPLAIFGAPVARFAGVPVVLSSIRGQRNLYSSGHERLLQFSDRFVHGIVANASSLVDFLGARGTPREFTRLCQNGIDTRPYEEIQRDLARPLTIGAVCVLRPEKNLELLMRAFSQLTDRASLRLRITGSGPMLESLKTLAVALRLESDVLSFHPATRDVPAALGEIDIFVSASFSEGLSNSIMEAMAAGCAVAASAVGGNLELIQDRATGLLFDPLRVETLTQALRTLVDDAPLRIRIAESGREWIGSNFSMAASARTMGSIYDGYLLAAGQD